MLNWLVAASKLHKDRETCCTAEWPFYVFLFYGTGLSDHELVYCVRKINCKKFPAQTKLFRNYAKYNNEAFCSDLGKVDWEQLCNPTG